MVRMFWTDQICLLESRGAKSVKLLPQVSLKTYPGFPHGEALAAGLTQNVSGIPPRYADQIHADLRVFFRESVAIAA
jgi:hypothetical protein